MSRYIKVEDAIEAAINGCASWDGGYFPSMDEPIKEEFEAVDDKCIDLVRCGECKYCYSEGFVNVRNVCEKHYDFGNVDDDWFCADGERRSDD